MITKRRFIAAIGVGSLAPFTAFAQPQKEAARIGFLSAAPLSSITARTKALLDGLNELGYVDGKNILIEWRSADEHWDRLPQLADELVKLKVAVIVTAEGPATIAAKKVTSTLPIVMGQSGDPVKMGVVGSLAHPGTNVTGLTTLSTDLPGKQVELLKEAVPQLSKLAVLFNPANALSDAGWKIVRSTAKTLGLALVSQSVGDAKQFGGAFTEMMKAGASGLLVLPDPMLLSQRTQIAALAAKHKLPAIYGIPEYAEAGGLIAYAASRTDSFHRAAVYIDKILKGAKPADLPVEQPTKFELAINMNTAKALGLKIPNSILVRADRVIE
jgi:putative tryptophan/tyrosine transport system substrate-binding protein